MVRVAVQHAHAPDLALDLHPPLGPAVAGQPGRDLRRLKPSSTAIAYAAAAFRALCRPGTAIRSRTGRRASPGRPVTSNSVDIPSGQIPVIR